MTLSETLGEVICRAGNTQVSSGADPRFNPLEFVADV